MKKSIATSDLRAFTLVEMISVMAIMVILTALSVPAFNSLGSSGRLDSAGRLVSNLVFIARSEAINQRTLVQLRIITTNQTGTDDVTTHYRKMSLWKLNQSQTPPAYVQFSQWETLPDGIIIEPATSPSYPLQSSNPNPTSNPYAVPSTSMGTYYLMSSANLANADNPDTSVTVGGATYNFVYLQFSPNGGTYFSSSTSPSTVYLMLTEGFLPASPSTTPVYTRNHADWMQVTVNCLTGMSKVIRP